MFLKVYITVSERIEDLQGKHDPGRNVMLESTSSAQELFLSSSVSGSVGLGKSKGLLYN